MKVSSSDRSNGAPRLAARLAHGSGGVNRPARGEPPADLGAARPLTGEVSIGRLLEETAEEGALGERQPFPQVVPVHRRRAAAASRGGAAGFERAALPPGA